MKLRRHTIIAPLALLAASCAHEESEVAQISDVQVVIEASFSDMVTETRATATAFESGDMLGLYAVKSGGELNAASNLINNHQLKVAASGAIVGDLLPAYYPDKSSSLDLFSYYPYQSGNATADALGVLVGIRTHQTDFSSLQASDLCYGRKLDAAPSAAPHPLQFNHSFAQLRLNFSLYEGCSAISAVKLLSIKDRAKLNLQTGVVNLLTTSVVDVDPFVNNLLSYTAIVPAQSLSGACVEITLSDGTIYYYHAVSPIALTASATNTLNLNIADKKMVTASGAVVVEAWGAVESSGSLGESASNLVTLYWLAPHASYASIDKITVSLVDLFNRRREVDVTPTIDPLSSAEYATYTFPLILGADAGYPQIIENLKLYAGATLLRDSPRAAIIGSVLTKAGAHTLGLNLAIEISPKEDWLNVVNTAQTRAITIHTIGTTKWTATATGAGLTVSPATGTSGQVATIAWTAQLTTGDSPARQGAVSFVTDPTGASQTITTSQLMGPYYLAVNPASAWANVANTAQTRSHTVSTGNLAGWTVAATGAGLSVAPASGTNGQAAVATWEANSVVGSLARSGSITFSPNPATVGGVATAAPITFSTTQVAGPAPTLTLNSYSGGWIANSGGYGYTTVTSNHAWTATGSNTNYVSPSSGSAGSTSVTIYATINPYTYSRSISATFRTNNTLPNGTTATQSWSASQYAAPSNAVYINGLWWADRNVGASYPYSYGNHYAFGTNPCPSGWRVPSINNLQSLISAGYSSWTSYGGINGRWFGPSAGNSSTSIFLPASGTYTNEGGPFYRNEIAWYWSSTTYSGSYGRNIQFTVDMINNDSHAEGHAFPVRCVSN